MGVNALVQNATATLVAVGWKVAGAVVLREAFGEAGYPSPMPAYGVSGMFAGPPVAH